MKNTTHYLPLATLVLIVAALLLLAEGVAAWPASSQAPSESIERTFTTPPGRNGITAPGATLFSYQGQLLDIANNEPVHGYVGMTFSLYYTETEGIAFWTETYTATEAISVTNGIFHVLLGSLVPIDPNDLTGDVYLDLAVNGETLSPRELLTSVAYAVEAATVPDGSITNAKLALQGDLPLGGDGTTGASYSGSYTNLSLWNSTGNIRSIAAGSLYYFLDSDNNSTDAVFRVLKDSGSFIAPVADVFQVAESGDVTGYGNLYVRGTLLHVNSDADGSTAQIKFQNNDFLTYDDATNSPGTFSFDVDGNTGNAFLLAGGAYLSTGYDAAYKLKVDGITSLEDNQLYNARALQLKDWDDDTGGADAKYRVLARDGAWQFYNGGVVVGSYSDGTWTDVADGVLIVESKVGIGATSPSEKLHVGGNIRMDGSDLIVRYTPRGDGGRALVHMNGDTLVINYDGDFAGGVRMDSSLNMNGHGISNCGALVEANLQTEEELAAGHIDRLEEGDVLCWGLDRLEPCSTAGDRLVQAVADAQGRPIVLGAEVIKVIGPVKRGDILVASDVPGYAMVNNDPVSGSVIAQALEDFEGEQGLIKAMIRKF